MLFKCTFEAVIVRQQCGYTKRYLDYGLPEQTEKIGRGWRFET